MPTTLSKRQKDNLRDSVRAKCIDASEEIIKYLQSINLHYEDIEVIDKILYRLRASAPKVALRVFESNTTTTPKTQPTKQKTE